MTYTPTENPEIITRSLSAERLFGTVMNAATEGRRIVSTSEKIGTDVLNLDIVEPLALVEDVQRHSRHQLLGVLALGSPLVLLGIVAVERERRAGLKTTHDAGLGVVHMGSDGRAPRRIADINVFGGEIEIGRGSIGNARGANSASERHVRLEMKAGSLVVDDLKTTNGTTLYMRDSWRPGMTSLGIVDQLRPDQARPDRVPAASWVVGSEPSR